MWVERVGMGDAVGEDPGSRFQSFVRKPWASSSGHLFHDGPFTCGSGERRQPFVRNPGSRFRSLVFLHIFRAGLDVCSRERVLVELFKILPRPSYSEGLKVKSEGTLGECLEGCTPANGMSTHCRIFQTICKRFCTTQPPASLLCIQRQRRPESQRHAPIVSIHRNDEDREQRIAERGPRMTPNRRSRAEQQERPASPAGRANARRSSPASSEEGEEYNAPAPTEKKMHRQNAIFRTYFDVTEAAIEAPPAQLHASVDIPDGKDLYVFYVNHDAVGKETQVWTLERREEEIRRAWHLVEIGEEPFEAYSVLGGRLYVSQALPGEQ
ncbi:hypothetical protein K523DRAFT_333983 [Schizophyllum commune Tattone D]|nr:hypothetical protein K523DRAFT_333983 [Schizophyllum commune Tattone D]